MAYEREPTLRDLVQLVRRGFVLAAAVGLVAGAVTYLVNRAAEPSFEAQATIVSSSQDASQRDFGTTLVTAPPLDATGYRVAITSRPVLSTVFERVDGVPPTQAEVDGLARSLSVRVESTADTSLFRIVVTDATPSRARDLANGIADAALRWDEQRATRSLESIIESLGAQIASIDAELAATEAPAVGLERTRGDLALQLSSARALRSGAIGRLELLEAADTPRSAVSPRPTRNAALAVVLGALLIYGALLVRILLDTRIRDVDELVRVTGLPLLAEFPKVAGGRRKLPTEAASYLRTAVNFATASDVDPKVLLVTSTGANDGRSSVSMALAESFSRQHYRVLLIDADLRRAVLGTEYGVDRRPNTTVRDALVDPAAVVPITIELGRELTLDLLPSFDPVHNPTELLANHMGELLHHVATEYDVIVIDCAPVLPVADALTVAPYTSGVVFVASVPDTERNDVIAAIELLRRVGVRVLGTVATNLPKERHRRAIKGYDYRRGADVPEEAAALGGAIRRRSPIRRAPRPDDEGGAAPKRSAPPLAVRVGGEPRPRSAEKVASRDLVVSPASAPAQLVVADFPPYKGSADVNATIELPFPRVVGGQEPYVFELTAGALPPPFTTRSVGEGRGAPHTGGTVAIVVGPDGALRGATGWPGRYSGTVTVTDAYGHTANAEFELDLALSLTYVGDLEIRVPAEPAVVVPSKQVRVSGVPVPALPATGMDLFFELTLEPDSSHGTAVRAPEQHDFAIHQMFGSVSMMRPSPGHDVLVWTYQVVAHRAERVRGVLVPLEGGPSSAPVTLAFVRP